MSKRPISQDANASVVDRNGLQGIIVPDGVASHESTTHVLIRFENGIQVVLPRKLLHRRSDRIYQLELSADEVQDRYQLSVRTQEENAEEEQMVSVQRDKDSSFVLPISQEQLNVDRRTVQTGSVAIHKTVQEQVQVVDEAIFSEEVNVERVPINQPVDTPPPVRHEGDTLVIPLVEEVLYVEKRLVLREEIHVKKLRRELHDPQQVTLRQEKVEIERQPGT